MGNMGSSGRGHSRRRHRNHNNHPPPPPPPPQTPQTEITGNRYVSPAAIPFPHNNHPPPPPPPPQTPQTEITENRYVSPAAIPFPDPSQTQHNQNLGNYPTPPPPMMSVHAADPGHASWVGGRHPCAPPLPLSAPYVQHQKAVTIRNDVNIRKETMRVEPDEENPGQFLVAFTFDATVSGSITVIFFAKEDADCNLIPTKENLLEPITVSFQQGLCQKFRQPSGTGIDFLMFEETKLLEGGNEEEVYPLAVKAEAYALDHNGSEAEKPMPGTVNSLITEAVFEKERGGYQVKVVKQILWVNGVSYELQEIYGIRNSVDCELDGNGTGKECVICLSEPQDTTVLPCRHMCLCSECAKLLQFQTNRCPICRQPVERLLEIKVNNKPDDE